MLALLSALMAAWQSDSFTGDRGIGGEQALFAADVTEFQIKQVAKLTHPDGAAGDGFGNAAAIDGNTIAVGAQAENNSQGAVYVFVKPANGWQATTTYAAKLVASDGAAADQFGSPIVIRGDTIVVGAHVADVDGKVNQGAVWVFVKPAGGWSGTVTESAKLTVSNGAADDLFGVQADMNETGSVIVVGGHHVDNSRGAAFVFVKPAGGWTGNLHENAKLRASGGAPGDFMGRGLGISGDTIAVGAYGVNGWSGRAYVFLKPAGGWNGTLYESAQLDKSVGGYGEFGSTIRVKGETVAVGAYTEDGWRGAVYVFVKPVAGWSGSLTESAKLTASDREGGDFYGYEGMALDENRIVIGAHQDTVGANSEQGSAYVFDKPDGGWNGNLTETIKLTASDGAAEDWFGLAIGLSSRNIVVGAHRADIGGNQDKGTAYIFHSDPTADLALVKTYSAPARDDKPYRFELLVKNLGPDRAKTIVVTDALPDGVQFVKAVGGQAECATVAQVVTCTLGRLDANATVTIRLRVRILGQHRTLKNCANVQAETFDPDASNNEACIEIQPLSR